MRPLTNLMKCLDFRFGAFFSFLFFSFLFFSFLFFSFFFSSFLFFSLLFSSLLFFSFLFLTFGLQSITAENIPSENSRLWAVMVGEFLLIVGFLMYLYRFSLFYLEKPTNLSRFGTSVMVQGINRDVVDSTRLERHVQRMFPGTKVTATIIPGFSFFFFFVYFWFFPF